LAHPTSRHGSAEVTPGLYEEGPAVNGADRDRDVVIVG